MNPSRARVRYSSALNRFQTRFWISELLAIHQVSLKDIESVLNKEPSALVYKWKTGKVGARDRSVFRIAEVYENSELSFCLPLFQSLRIPLDNKRLRNLIDEIGRRAQLVCMGENVHLARYACLDSLANSIALVRLASNHEPLKTYARSLEHVAFSLRTVISCHDWFTKEFANFVRLLKRVVTHNTPYGDIEAFVDWWGVFTLAVDDCFFFYNLENEAPFFHKSNLDSIRKMNGAEDLVTFYVGNEVVRV